MVKAVMIGIGSLVLTPMLALAALAGAFRADPSLAAAIDPATLADQTALQVAVLANHAIGLTPSARIDVGSGRVDPRVLAVLLTLARTYRLTSVGPLITGHCYYVKGTDRVSNHVYGRAADITAVNGKPVSVSNPDALSLLRDILSLPASIRPDELGGPWLLHSDATRTFADENHRLHAHFGWDHDLASHPSQPPTTRSC